MTILEHLKKDHDILRDILDQIEQLVDTLPDMDEEEAIQLLKKLQSEIDAHNEAEEDIFYEALKEKDEDSLLPYLGFEEHRLAANIVIQLLNDEMDIMQRAAKMKALKDIIMEHLEEEEDIFFETAESMFNAQEQKKLGQAFADKKSSLR